MKCSEKIKMVFKHDFKSYLFCIFPVVDILLGNAGQRLLTKYRNGIFKKFSFILWFTTLLRFYGNTRSK